MKVECAKTRHTHTQSHGWNFHLNDWKFRTHRNKTKKNLPNNYMMMFWTRTIHCYRGAHMGYICLQQLWLLIIIIIIIVIVVERVAFSHEFDDYDYDHRQQQQQKLWRLFLLLFRLFFTLLYLFLDFMYVFLEICAIGKKDESFQSGGVFYRQKVAFIEQIIAPFLFSFCFVRSIDRPKGIQFCVVFLIFWSWTLIPVKTVWLHTHAHTRFFCCFLVNKQSFDLELAKLKINHTKHLSCHDMYRDIDQNTFNRFNLNPVCKKKKD